MTKNDRKSDKKIENDPKMTNTQHRPTHQTPNHTHTHHTHTTTPKHTKKEREGAQALKPPNSKTERFLLSVDGDTALHHRLCWGLRRRNSYVLLEQT